MVNDSISNFFILLTSHQPWHGRLWRLLAAFVVATWGPSWAPFEEVRDATLEEFFLVVFPMNQRSWLQKNLQENGGDYIPSFIGVSRAVPMVSWHFSCKSAGWNKRSVHEYTRPWFCQQTKSSARKAYDTSIQAYLCRHWFVKIYAWEVIFYPRRMAICRWENLDRSPRYLILYIHLNYGRSPHIFDSFWFCIHLYYDPFRYICVLSYIIMLMQSLVSDAWSQPFWATEPHHEAARWARFLRLFSLDEAFGTMSLSAREPRDSCGPWLCLG